MKKLNITFVLSLMLVAALGMFSCLQEDVNVLDQKTQFGSDEEKIQMVSSLFESFGWQMESDLNEEELNKAILAIDYDEAKAFLEDLKKGWVLDGLPGVAGTETRGSNLTYTIFGNHSSYFATSTTEMTLSYNFPELTTVKVTNTRVSSNPASTWSPDAPYGSFSFSGDRCDVSATGKIKYGSIYSGKYKMSGYITKKGTLISDGKVESFREVK